MKLKLLKSLYSKQSILYTIDLYLDIKDCEIDDDKQNYYLNFSNIDKETFDLICQELNFNALRFEISDLNKDIRKTIISQALWSINIE